MIKFADHHFEPELKYSRRELRKLCEKHDLRLVILHGSRVLGKLHKESDIDIGILAGAGSPGKCIFDIQADFTDLFGERCDLVILNHAESMIVYQVAVKGAVLYESRKGLFADYKTTAITRYQDARKFRALERQYLKDVIERMGRHG
ncbi:MAG: nucleotidyltransferase domain-containing protein [Candidatus Omnitrophica bacterium]|nr:nucleotidyltransferase domain-containing protein [Candidatus Omnitrophota bacterium]MBI5024328.1 nucleotidyltransferase domain-containing protein [Candidatus Omnitrophota bacterium]